jgi:hypothetical protein
MLQGFPVVPALTWIVDDHGGGGEVSVVFSDTAVAVPLHDIFVVDG